MRRVPALSISAILAASAFLAAGATGCQKPAARLGTLLPHRSETLAAAPDLGRAAPAEEVELSVYLALPDVAAAERYAHDVQDPASPSYHRFLRPGEFQARFGASASDEAAVRAFLEDHGFTAGERIGQRLVIRGTAADAERAFGVEMHRYEVPVEAPDGTSLTRFLAADREPKVPAEIAGRVTLFGGLAGVPGKLHPRLRLPHAKEPHVGYGQAALAGAYGFSTLHQAGILGRGQTIAVYELSGYYHKDLEVFAARYGIHLDGAVGQGPSIRDVIVDNADPNRDSGGGAIEVELDMQIILELAPAATQLVYIAPNNAVGPLDIFNAINTDGLASVVSISWGDCEPNYSAADFSAQHALLVQSGAQGISLFAAAGDNGAYDCGDSRLAVDSPADDPFVTGVGGTTLAADSTTGNYSGETAWAYGGGGLSTEYDMPDFQKTSVAAGVHNPYTNGKRQVPDVAADADTRTGPLVYFGRCTTDPCPTQGWTPVGGTSAASPLWSAAWALVQQKAGARQVANEALYWLAGNPQGSPPFHDVAAGTNSYYPAGAGYDFATGLGTPQVDNIAADLAVAGAAGLSAAPSPLSFGKVPSAAPSTRTVTVTNSGKDPVPLTGVSFHGPDAARFGATGATGPLAAGGSTPVTVTFTPAGPGAARATLVVSTGFGYGVRSVEVPVDADASDSALTASPPSLHFAVARLGSTSAPQTVTLTNGGTAAVALSAVSLAPADFTLVGSAPSSVPAGGSASFQVAFAPAAGGAVSGLATVKAADGDLHVALSGSGAAARIAAAKSSVAFPSRFFGEVHPTRLKVTNTGDAELHLQAAIDPPFTVKVVDATIAPDATGEVELDFLPTVEGTVTGTLTLSSADGDCAAVPVGLSGIGVEPKLSADPTELDFGEGPIGATSDAQRVKVRNDSSGTMIVQPVIDPKDSEFMIVGTSYQAIDAGKTSEWAVAYVPRTVGAKTAKLSLRRSGSTYESASVSLKGAGYKKSCGCGGPVAGPLSLLLLALKPRRRR